MNSIYSEPKASIVVRHSSRGPLYYGELRYKMDGNWMRPCIPLKTRDEVEINLRLSEIVMRAHDYINANGHYLFSWQTPNGTPGPYSQGISIEKACSDWLHDKIDDNEIRGNTIPVYKSALNRFKDFAGDQLKKKTLSDITADDIRQYKKILKDEKLMDNSINIHLRPLKSMFKHFAEIGKLDRVPLIKQKKVESSRERYIPSPTFDKILEHESDEQLRDIYRYYRATGLRALEGADCEWVENDGGPYILVRNENTKKGKGGGRIPVSLFESDFNNPEDFKKAHHNLRAIFDSNLDCSCGANCKHRKSVFKQNIGNKWRKALSRAGLRPKKIKFKVECKVSYPVFHDLRHTFAVRSMIKTYRPYNVMRLMRHRNLSTTMKYVVYEPSDLEGKFPELILDHNKWIELGE